MMQNNPQNHPLPTGKSRQHNYNNTKICSIQYKGLILNEKRCIIQLAKK